MEKQLMVQKMDRRMREMEDFRFLSTQDLFPLEILADLDSPEQVQAVPQSTKPAGEAPKGYDFVGRDRYLWLRKEAKVPPAQPGCRPMGRFNFGRTGAGHNSGFEALLYLNGKPFQGVDTNHQEVMLEDYAGQRVDLTFLLWSGLEGGGPPKVQEHRLRQAEFGWLHLATDALYYKSKALVKTLRQLPEDHPAWNGLYAAMEAALMELDWDPDRFHSTAPAALAVLDEKLSKMEKHRDLTVTCVGHTHIDLAWLWRLKHTREKAIRSFSTVLRLMEEFDEYIFLQSQAQLYQFVKEDEPALYARIQEAVASGRWEVDGGMWVEADCNISSGEALTRQFLYGMRFFEREFGKRSTCLWLPDVFGYSWALPQIMKQCGLTTFVTSKISWNQFNSMPDDLFRWRGIDGTEILTYFITIPDVGRSLDDRFATYNGMISPRSLIGGWQKFRNKELSPEILLPFGFGDGGGGPTRNMLNMRRATDALPGLPAVECGATGEFLQRLHQRTEGEGSPIHTWDGELYLEYHRGTYTSEARNKKWNRKLENLLAEAEMLSVLAMANGGRPPREALRESWEIVLRNQFHDIIPGSSIREVYVDSIAEYEQADALLADARQSLLPHLVEKAAGYTSLFSSSSFGGNRLVWFEGKTGSFYLDGQVLVSQSGETGSYVEVPMRALALNGVRHREETAATPPSPFHPAVGERQVESPHYRITWNEEGRFTQIYDIDNQRNVLSGFGGRFEVYEDKPLDNENWDIELYHTQKREQPLFVSAAVVEEGPLRCAIRFSHTYRHSTLQTDMVLYAGSRRIDFETRADWHESRRLLKAAFDTGLRATKATYDIQYGYVERPTHRNTSWDVARFEVVGHKWADLSESNYGVSLLNDCKYGYSALGGELRLTLLRSGKAPDTEADMGAHEFTYALLPHAGPLAESDTLREADWLNLPVRVLPGKPKATQPLLDSLPKGVLVDAVKPAEDDDGYVLRLHECLGGSRKAGLRTSLPVREVQPCNLLEEPEDVPPTPSNWETAFTPFQLRTYLLRR